MILTFDLGSFNQVLIDMTNSSKWKPGDNAWEKLWQATAVTCSVSLEAPTVRHTACLLVPRLSPSLECACPEDRDFHLFCSLRCH